PARRGKGRRNLDPRGAGQPPRVVGIGAGDTRVSSEKNQPGIRGAVGAAGQDPGGGAPAIEEVTFVQIPPWNSQVSSTNVPIPLAKPPNRTIEESAGS